MDMSGLNDSQLLHQCKVVLNVPVVGNPAILPDERNAAVSTNSATAIAVTSLGYVEVVCFIA